MNFKIVTFKYSKFKFNYSKFNYFKLKYPKSIFLFSGTHAVLAEKTTLLQEELRLCRERADLERLERIRIATRAFEACVEQAQDQYEVFLIKYFNFTKIRF